MKRENYPIYLSAVASYLACDNKALTKALTNGELSQLERTLLLARKYFSAGEFREAITLLEGTSDSSCEFLNAEKNKLIATANCNIGAWENSFLYNGRAIQLFKLAQDRKGEFLCTYNLSVDADKLGLKKVALDYMDKAESLVEEIDQKFLVVRAKACRLSQDLNYEEAKKVIDTVLSDVHLCPNILDVLTLKSVASEIYFRAKDRSGAIALLEAIKDEKLLKPKARVFFNLAALRFMQGESLGSMPKHVQKSEEFSTKWNLLVALESGDLTLAKTVWQKLIALFPGLYLENFKGSGIFEEEGIFLQCVSTIRAKINRTQSVEFEQGSRMQVLHECLLQSDSPLRKEELIERVWKTSYDPSYDSRFYKLVQRLKDSQLPIVNEHRAYYYKSS